MKLSIIVAGNALALAMLASGCSSDPIPSTPDRNERYDREFVREFGVPDPNHTWSDASETTLTLVSSTRTPVRVYYQENDALYLVGDITAPAGEQPVPFMVPNGISSLIVETAKGRTTAPVGSRVNLDAITSASRATSNSYITETPLEERQILFTFENVTKKFFDAFPPGGHTQEKNNLYTDNKDRVFYTWIYCKDPDRKAKDFMLYPVFWKNDKRQFQSVENFLPRFATQEDYEGIFPLKIDFSFGTKDYESDRVPTVFISTSNWSSSGPADGGVITYRSYGIRYKNRGGGFGIGQNFGDIEVTMDNLMSQSTTLTNRFWNVKAQYLDRAYNTMLLYYPKNTSVTYKVPVKTEEGGYEWEERTSPACFIGVSQPPIARTTAFSLGDEYLPDFCDIVYLVVPVDKEDEISTYSASAGVNSTSLYTFAAEDLGGSYDWDFNDVVFTASCVTYDTTQAMIEQFNLSRHKIFLYPKSYQPQLKIPYIYRITVKANAAGGTMPVYIAYNGSVSKSFEKAFANYTNDPDMTYNEFATWMDRLINSSSFSYLWYDGISIVGTEVHKWLGGTSTATPLNVGGPLTHTGREVTFYAKAGLDYHNGAIMSGDNEALKNFFIIVDKENKLGIDTSEAFDPTGEGTAANAITPFDGVFGEGSYKIGAVSEDKSSVVPQMICLSGAWQWPLEERHISLGYPKFRDWVSDQSTSWMYDTNEDHLNANK